MLLYNSFGNGRKLQLIVHGCHNNGTEIQECQPNNVVFSDAIVRSFDLSVCANTLDLSTPTLKLHYPGDLIDRSMRIMDHFTQFNVPNRVNTENKEVELIVYLLRRRLTKVHKNLLIFILNYLKH